MLRGGSLKIELFVAYPMKSLCPLAPGALGILVCLASTPLSAQITLNSFPTRVIGQTSLTINSTNPNLVEGRELLNPQGIAIDRSTNPPGLYIADTGNNRILGFRNATAFANGQKADVVVGQPDFATTFAQGPGRTRTTGLSSPTGVTVDAAGNLYVVDSGNNRILRFPVPLANSGDQVPDLVLGQATFTTNGSNQGGISASTLALTATTVNGTSPLAAYAAVDSSGNLWMTDPGNNRVLRYPAAALTSNPTPGAAADLVLGQFDFVTGTVASGITITSTFAMVQPTGIVFDSVGRLFIAESTSSARGRILMFTPPFRLGQSATRLLGVNQDSPAPPTISELQLGPASGALVAVGNQLGIADTFNNRVLLYPPVEQWTSNTLDQSAIQVIGQPDFNSGSFNQGQPNPGPSTLGRPAAAAYFGNELFIVDSLNHRVIVTPGSSFSAATRVIGQDTLNTGNANLIEGREFNFSAGVDAGLAVDLNSNPPHIYVADTYNNRVLGFRDLRNLQPGQKADIVIGQPDFQHALVNYPNNNPNQPNQASLFEPTGLFVDAKGSLYVADTGNGRVLRFPDPFGNYQAGVPEKADLVIGQLNFTTKITDPTAVTLAAPYGIAQAAEHGLLISDPIQNRVLLFPGTPDTFTNGERATLVFGQKNFTSAGAGSDGDQLSSPHHIAVDSDNHLFIADTGNNRLSIFDHAPTASPDPFAAITLTGFSSPRAVHISPVTDEIWVGDTGNNKAFRFPHFNSLAASNFASNLTLVAAAPLAMAEDAWGNIFIADVANRVVTHYPGLSLLNAANYLYQQHAAPGMIAALFSLGNFHQFGTTSDAAKAIPLPSQLNGVQVLVDNKPAPLFFAGTDQINFEVPMGAVVGGVSNVQVVETGTGRLLGDTFIAISSAVPGLFTQAANGSGAAIAANKDGSLNTQTNPARAGEYITLYGTGQGFVNGAPLDGDAPKGPLPTSRPPTVVIGGLIVTGDGVQYAGLAPALVGVWQVNVKIPDQIITLPTNPTQVVVLQDSQPSGGGGLGRAVIIYVCNPTAGSCTK
jgi:uncharacterized protein (TIGR03437 family)